MFFSSLFGEIVMNAVEPKLRVSFFVRQAIVGGIFLFFGIVILSLAGKRGWLFVAVGVVPTLIWLAITVGTWIGGARRLDSVEATRRDGKRFSWGDLERVTAVKLRGTNAVNYFELAFRTGKMRVFPVTLENAGEVMAFIERVGAGKSG